MKIAISVESTNDLGKDLLNKYDIKVIPFHINLKDLDFYDGEYSTEEMLSMVEEFGVLPKTNAINEYEYTEYFEGLKKDYDAVVHIGLSSGITSSLGNAKRATNNVPNTFVVDSQSLSTGIGLLAIYARELAESGMAPDQIAKIVQERTDKLQVSFVVERLDFLHKGGRCNSIQLLGANLLKIRPRIVLKEGKMVNDGKYRGSMGKVIEKYCEETLGEYNTPNLDRVFITYTTATEEMVSAARKACENAGFKEIIQTRAGGTIASHCGGNTLGILYFNDAK